MSINRSRIIIHFFRTKHVSRHIPYLSLPSRELVGQLSRLHVSIVSNSPSFRCKGKFVDLQMVCNLLKLLQAIPFC